MTELPKIVKSRLRQQQGAGVSPHPDANLLAAFTEQALTPADRQQVLAHLAVCPECREITALSAPEIVAPADGAEATGGFFGLPPDFFRWGIVAASAAVVVAAVLLVKPELEQKSVPQHETARLESTQAPQTYVPESVASKDATAQAGKTADKVESAGDHSKQALAKSQPLAAPPPPPPSAGYAAANTVGGGTANSVMQAPSVSELKIAPRGRVDALNGALRNEPAAPARSIPDGAAKGEAEQYAYNAKEARDESKLAEVASAAKVKKDGTEGAREQDAKGFAVEGAADSSAAMEPVPAAPQFTAMRPAMAKARSADAQGRTWRITEGKLEWSLDAGKSWQKVNAPGGARFLSVDSRRTNVWAGGTSGVVIRSVDNGATWVPVTTGWTGDVVYLKFEDEKRGTLKTSTGEEWVTLDGGESWRKR